MTLNKKITENRKKNHVNCNPGPLRGLALHAEKVEIDHLIQDGHHRKLQNVYISVTFAYRAKRTIISAQEARL